VKNTKFNWQCIHCKARNIEVIKFQFDIPKTYTAEWPCEKCGKETKVVFIFSFDLPEGKK